MNKFSTLLLNTYYLVQSMNDFAVNVDSNIPNVDYQCKPELVHLRAFTLRCQERPYVKHLVRCADELRSVVHELLKHVLDIHRIYGIPIGIEEVFLIIIIF